MLDLSVRITQQAFGDLVGISQPAVSDLISRGVLPKDSCAGEWLIAYCAHLREVAAGRGDGSIDLARERALLAREQRQKVALQNAETRKEIAPRTMLVMVLARAGTKIGAKLDALIPQLKRIAPHLGPKGLALIEAEITRMRKEISELRLVDVVAEESADEDDEVDPGTEGAG